MLSQSAISSGYLVEDISMQHTATIPKSKFLAYRNSQPSATGTQLTELNNRMCNAVLIAVCILGFPAALASLSRVFEFGFSPVMAAQVLALIGLLMVTLNRRRLTYHLRVASLLITMYVLALSGLWSFGHLGGGKLMLLVFIVLTAMFAGTSYAHAAIALSATSLATFGWAYVSGSLSVTADQDAYHQSPQTWVTAVITIVLLGGFISTALSRMLEFQRNLLDSLDNEASYNATLIQQAAAALLVVDTNLVVRDANEEAKQLFAIGDLHENGVRLSNLLTDCAGKETLLHRLQSAVGGTQLANLEVKLRLPAGHHRDLIWNAAPHFDTDEQLVGLICVGQDVTELKQAQSKVLESARLTSLGEMTTSIAHEINQPLNAIRLTITNLIKKIKVQIAANKPVENEFLLPKLQRIDQQVERAAEITDHMRLFGSNHNETNEPESLSRVIDNTLTLIAEQLRLKNIRLEVHKPARDIVVDCNLLGLESALLNVLANAEYEVNRIADEQDKWIELNCCVEDDAVTVTISDSGGGIDSSVLPYIFDPFYTTKETGAGTGLGLSVTKNLLEKMGAEIRADNAPSGGAQFSIKLQKAR